MRIPNGNIKQMVEDTTPPLLFDYIPGTPRTPRFVIPKQVAKPSSKKETTVHTGKRDVRQELALLSKWVARLCEHAACPICMEPMVDPQGLVCANKCKTSVCKSCTHELMQHSRPIKCTICKSQVITIQPCTPSVSNVFASLPQTCDACGTMVIPTEASILAKEALVAHVQTCPSVKVACPNAGTHGCQHMPRRADVLQHLELDCEHHRCPNWVGMYEARPIGCCFRGTQKQVLAHGAKCAYTGHSKATEELRWLYQALASTASL